MSRIPLVSDDCFAACAWPVRTCAVVGRIGWISRTSCCGVTFGFPATPIESSFPSLRKIRCAVGRSKIESVAPPSEFSPPNLTRPTMRNVCSGPCATTPIVSPSAKCFDVAVALSIAISRGALGQRPLVSTSGLKRWLPAGLTLNARPGPVRRDHLAVVPDELRLVVDAALGVGDAGEAAHLRQQRLGERRHRVRLSVVRGPDRALAGDHRVRVLVDLREERVERGRDRVRQHVRAADHRDAEDDRDRGERGAQLAAHQALQRDGGHD